jgi:hypothetical protein
MCYIPLSISESLFWHEKGLHLNCNPYIYIII